MPRRAAEQTPEEVERKRQIRITCQRRYYQKHREEIQRKKNESYSPEKRRAEYLRHQAAEVARTRARRTRLKAEREAQQAGEAQAGEEA